MANIKAKINKGYVVIPAHNEASNIGTVIEDVKKYCQNIIVVDDGSSDETYDVATSFGVTVLRHSVNLGKGAALKTGCDYALHLGAKNLVVIDSDGQHEPKEIPKFFATLKNKDIVFSHRNSPKVMPGVLKFGNEFINGTLEKLFGIKIKDSQCGYRAFTSVAYKKVRWSASDYFMETEMIINAARNRLKYAQIPIATIYADKYKGTTVLDGVKIVMNMFTWRLLK
jgi:glycosyltransferase involved in cell wall biosynthesis